MLTTGNSALAWIVSFADTDEAIRILAIVRLLWDVRDVRKNAQRIGMNSEIC